MTQSTDTVWLTQTAYDKLQAELDHLRGEVRADITEKIAAARDEGDLKENGGYHAAREEQGKNEARIRQLESMLRRAEVSAEVEDSGVVTAGMKVTIKFAGDTDTEEFLLGERSLFALDESVNLDVYSPTSPLGAAILGKKPGEDASYEAPNGRTITVEVVDAVPF